MHSSHTQSTSSTRVSHPSEASQPPPPLAPPPPKGSYSMTCHWGFKIAVGCRQWPGVLGSCQLFLIPQYYISKIVFTESIYYKLFIVFVKSKLFDFFHLSMRLSVVWFVQHTLKKVITQYKLKIICSPIFQNRPEIKSSDIASPFQPLWVEKCPNTATYMYIIMYQFL